MALPDGVQTVTLTDTRQHPDGAPYTGTLTLRPEVPAVTSAEHGLIVMGDVVGTWVAGVLQAADGTPGLTVLAVDDPTCTPTGWTYRAYEAPTGGLERDYPLLLTADLGTIDLADLAPAEPSAGEYVLVAGPPGAQGEPGADGAPGEQGPPGTAPTGDTIGVTRAAYKPADEQVATSTVLQADDHLSISVTAGAAYAIDSCLLVTGDPAGDLMLTVTAPLGSVGGWTPTATTLGTTDGTGSVRLTRFDFGASSSMGATTTGVVVNPTGGIIAGADGTVTIQWAQAVSSGTPTTLRAGSWLRLTRM